MATSTAARKPKVRPVRPVAVNDWKAASGTALLFQTSALERDSFVREGVPDSGADFGVDDGEAVVLDGLASAGQLLGDGVDGAHAGLASVCAWSWWWL